MAKNKNKKSDKDKDAAKDKESNSKLDPKASASDRELYDRLREAGVGKRKSAAVANAIAADARSQAAVKGGSSSPYDTWSRADLYDRAKELDITGRSGMGKDELIAALREH